MDVTHEARVRSVPELAVTASAPALAPAAPMPMPVLRMVETGGPEAAAEPEQAQRMVAPLSRLRVGGAAGNVVPPPESEDRAATFIRRTITGPKPKEAPYPSTWHKAMKLEKQDAMIKAAQEVKDASTLDDKAFKTAWNKLAKNDKHVFSVTKQTSLLDALIASSERSKKSSAGAKIRAGGVVDLTKPLIAKNSGLELKPSAQNPMVVSSNPAKFDYSKADRAGRARDQTRLSTVVLDVHGGIEAQASMHHQGRGLFVSTNHNDANRKLQAEATNPVDFEMMATKVAFKHGLATMTHNEAMANRPVRHSMKTFNNLRNSMASDAPVYVPPDQPSVHDGRHTEIRIHQDTRYDPDAYAVPSGTKYPCAGCRLYFAKEGVDAGNRMGPVWVTGAGLSTQLAKLHEKKLVIGKLGAEGCTIAEDLATEYAELMKSAVRMGESRQRDGTYTVDTNPDSDSEDDFSPEDFLTTRKRMSSRLHGAPPSPDRRFTLADRRFAKPTHKRPRSAEESDESGADMEGLEGEFEDVSPTRKPPRKKPRGADESDESGADESDESGADVGSDLDEW